MIKLIKQKYYGKDGEVKINCYHVNLAKSLVEKAGLDKVEYIKVSVENGKIIIERA